MGRDWYWSSSSKKQEREARQGEEPSPPPGCMSGLLNLFDFHQFQFPITHPPCFKPHTIPQEDPTSVKGVAAPRNSLESDDGITLGMSTELKQEGFHDTVEMKIIATRRIDEVSCSDSSSSPGPKTPSLVARLMGLDLLPDTSPSPSSKPFSELLRKDHQLPLAQPIKNKHKRNCKNAGENEMSGSRSLPDTPRISSARRSDVDARFSLQINKENMSAEEFEQFIRISKDRRSKSRDFGNVEENKEKSTSTGHYARQIVKQVKESVSRRAVGLDITNTTNNKLKTKEVDVVVLKSKKPRVLSKIGEESTASKSPRPRLCELIDQAAITPKPRSPPSGPPQISMQSEFSAKQKPKLQRVEKCKKASCERFAQRRQVRALRGSKPPRKKPQLTKEIDTVSTESASPLVSLSHDYQLRPSKPSCSSTTWSDRQNNSNKINDRTCTDFGDEIRYVSEILKCTGITKDTVVSFARWYSPSHPLDPSIFHDLEDSPHVGGSLQPRCNRRLIFNLMDELLSNLIKPYLNMKPWIKQEEAPRSEMRGDALLRGLCWEMARLPSLDCQTLEDIDSLIDKDLPDTKMRRLPISEETESIVFEIEQDILDSLVRETAGDVMHHMLIHVTGYCI